MKHQLYTVTAATEGYVFVVGNFIGKHAAEKWLKTMQNAFPVWRFSISELHPSRCSPMAFESFASNL